MLDIGAYLAGEAGAAAPLARAIARTCEDTGFLVVANHGVPPATGRRHLRRRRSNSSRGPKPDKLALKIGKYNIGYLPFGGQVVRHSPVNKNTKPNFSESFYITRDRAPDHPDIVNNKPLVGLNRWPDGHARVPRRDDGVLRAMEAMTTRLVPLVRAGARSAGRLFRRGLRRAELHDPADPLPAAPDRRRTTSSASRRIPTTTSSRSWRSRRCPGLEVRTAEGEWIRPPAVPGTFVVNTGAMLARYSNDRFRATPHRVINRNDRSRYASRSSSGRTTMSSSSRVPTCVGPDNPPKYEPTTYGAFTQRLLTLNFAHRQAGGSGEYAG